MWAELTSQSFSGYYWDRGWLNAQPVEEIIEEIMDGA
jgi:hypothetical protein